MLVVDLIKWRNNLRILILFSAICPFVPRLIHALDTQPTFLILVLIDVLFFGWHLRKSVVNFLICYVFILTISALWNWEGIHSFQLVQFINSLVFLVTVLYFITYIREYSYLFSKNASLIFIYIVIISSLYLWTNGLIERSLFTQREFIEIDSGRGISPLSPEPAAFAKILWSLILASILLKVPRRVVYIFISLFLLVLNASGAAILAIFSIVLTFFKIEVRHLLIATAVGLLLLYILKGYLDSLFLNMRGFDLFLSVLNSGNLDVLLLDQSFNNRIESFNLAWSHFLRNPLFGSFFTFEVMGGLVSLVGQLGIVVLLSFALLIFIILKKYGSNSFSFLLFISVLFISDSFTIPLYSLVIALLISPKSNYDLLHHTA